MMKVSNAKSCEREKLFLFLLKYLNFCLVQETNTFVSLLHFITDMEVF